MEILHQSQSHSFASDNYSGVLPEVMEAIACANGGHTGAYGNDPYTAHLQTLIRTHFGQQAQGFPVFNGTGANILALQSLLPRWGAVICAQSAHINVDESTAPQAVGGFKLWTIETPDGKLTPDLIAQEAHGFGFEHRAQPAAVYLTQSTELGTVYSIEELRAISDYCHKLGLAVHMDGARLANAASALGVSLQEITTDVGVDIVSLGGTKNGLLLGECVIMTHPMDSSESLKYLRKMNLQLASKMRFISAQLIAYFEDDLWRKAAGNANARAAQLSEAICQIDGVQLVYPTQANAVFVRLPQGVADKVRKTSFFYDWDNKGTVRFVCSFDTTAEDVEILVQAIKNAIRLLLPF